MAAAVVWQTRAARLWRPLGKAAEFMSAPFCRELSELSLCVPEKTSGFLSEGHTRRVSLGRSSCPMG